METLEFVLIVLSCVVLSSVLDKFSRVSLPVLQVAIGLVITLVAPSVLEVRIDAELFLVLFIAPLLFNETREADPKALWNSRADILSLAIGLVVASVLTLGYALNWLVPSIPLAAAFAFAAALGPTDAATVTALRSSVCLTERQRTLLSGESLINDASGVVAFQFSVAAAVTGAFSVTAVLGSFALLFVGGIVVGFFVGLLLSLLIGMLRRLGFEDVTAHVLYEVLTPFLVYLFAESLHVSGILAVVAAGLVIARPAPRLSSPTAARQRLVSDSFWRVISFLINGTVFVFLGMQLPLAVTPGLNGGLGLIEIVGIVLIMALLSHACRFLWLYLMELLRAKRGQHLCGPGKDLVRDVLVTTIAGAKGAVTLSIALTLPYTVDSGAAFPQRELIITITAGVILTTLLLADSLLPRLAPMPDSEGNLQERVREGSIAVLSATLGELRAMMSDSRVEARYIPALRLTITRYSSRLLFERISTPETGPETLAIIRDTNTFQEARLKELHLRHLRHHDETPWETILEDIRSIRRSVGYIGPMANIGTRTDGNSRLRMLASTLRRTLHRLWSPNGNIRTISDDDRAYFQACIYAIELEYTEIERLNEIAAGADSRKAEIAKNLLVEHESAVESIWSRINIGQEGADTGRQSSYVLPYNLDSHEIAPRFREQIAHAREYADDVDENALRIELDQIIRLQSEGTIDREVATKLRENVYYLQMAYSE